MSKWCAAILILCGAGICLAQSNGLSKQAPKHYRLTFVLTYPQNQQPSQSFVLDVPVLADHPGMSGMSMASGPAGMVEGSMQENLQCTDVHASATGLAAKVNFVVDSVPSELLPGMTEPLHRHLVFERQIDVAIGKPTRITQEMHVQKLGKDTPPALATPPPAPQITVTAVEI